MSAARARASTMLGDLVACIDRVRSAGGNYSDYQSIYNDVLGVLTLGFEQIDNKKEEPVTGTPSKLPPMLVTKRRRDLALDVMISNPGTWLTAAEIKSLMQGDDPISPVALAAILRRLEGSEHVRGGVTWMVEVTPRTDTHGRTRYRVVSL